MAAFLLGFLLDPKDGEDIFRRDVDGFLYLLHDVTAKILDIIRRPVFIQNTKFFSPSSGLTYSGRPNR
jgi:hypothetical protein